MWKGFNCLCIFCFTRERFPELRPHSVKSRSYNRKHRITCICVLMLGSLFAKSSLNFWPVLARSGRRFKSKTNKQKNFFLNVVKVGDRLKKVEKSCKCP